jgi:hypothetical protein
MLLHFKVSFDNEVDITVFPDMIINCHKLEKSGSNHKFCDVLIKMFHIHTQMFSKNDTE